MDFAAALPLARVVLDRAADLRADPGTLARARRDPATRVLVVGGGELVVDATGAAALLDPATAARVAGDDDHAEEVRPGGDRLADGHVGGGQLGDHRAADNRAGRLTRDDERWLLLGRDGDDDSAPLVLARRVGRGHGAPRVGQASDVLVHSSPATDLPAGEMAALDPGATTLDPGATTLDSGAAALDPGAAALDPGATALNPGATALDPGATAFDPGTTTAPQPGGTASPVPPGPVGTVAAPGSATTPTPAPGLRWASLRDAGADLPARDAGLATIAVALDEWHARHPRCPRCGAPTVPVQAGWVRVCTVDGSEHYPRTDPAIIVAVVDDEDRVLLGHNAAWPAGRFSTLAGFVEAGESAEHAVRREVAEETAVVVDHVEYRGSQPWPFPASLMLAYRGHAATTEVTVDGVEVTDARWFTRDELRTGVAAGEVLLPMRTSVAYALITDWFGAPLPTA